MQFNISHNKDEILKLPESKITENGGFTENSMWYKEGGPLYNQFRPEYAGVNEKGEATYWVDAKLGEGVTNRPGKNRDYTTTNPNNATKYPIPPALYSSAPARSASRSTATADKAFAAA